RQALTDLEAPLERSRRASAAELDQLDAVAVRVLDERDHRLAVLHRARLADDLDALRAEAIARRVDVLHAEGDVAEAVSDIVRLRVPVVGELEHGVRRLVAVADEREREAAAGKVVAAQELHPERARVERERLLEVVHPDHRVQHAHRAGLLFGSGPQTQDYRIAEAVARRAAGLPGAAARKLASDARPGPRRE